MIYNDATRKVIGYALSGQVLLFARMTVSIMKEPYTRYRNKATHLSIRVDAQPYYCLAKPIT